MHRLLLAVVASLLLAGCATVTRGTTEKVEVISEPAGGEATTSLGTGCSPTPCTIDVARKTEFDVTVSKPGYRAATVPVKTKLASRGAAGFAGNLILPGGTIGMVADAASGATLDHYPNPVRVTLAPSGGRHRKPRSGPRRHRATAPPAT